MFHSVNINENIANLRFILEKSCIFAQDLEKYNEKSWFFRPIGTFCNEYWRTGESNGI